MALKITSNTTAISTQASESSNKRLADTAAGAGYGFGSVGSVVDSAGDLDSSITIDIPDNVPDILLERSLSTVRPEIVAQVDFLPGQDGLNQTPEGRFLAMQMTLRSLAVENVAAVVAALTEDSATKDLVDALADQMSSDVSSVKTQIEFLGTIFDTVQSTKLALDPNSNESKIRNEIESIRNADGGQLPPISQYSSLKDIMVCQLGFADENFDAFSNTKILGQLAQDLKATLERTSPLLLTGYSDSRYTDADPIAITTEAVVEEDYPFVSTLLSSEANTSSTAGFSSFDPENSTDITAFTTALPSDEIQRIKTLVVAASKEARISAGIHNLKDTSYDELFDIQTGDLFDRIVGSLGTSIVEDEPAEGSLTSILRFTDGTDIVLPFEARSVIDPSGKGSTTYLPGSVVLVDSILQGEQKYDTTALEEFSSSAKSIVNNVATTVETLMGFDDEDEINYCATVLKKVYGAAYSSFSELSKTTTTSSSKLAALGSALLKAAYGDVTLRTYLVQYALEIRQGSWTTQSQSSNTDDGTSGGETPIDPGGGGTGGKGFIPGSFIDGLIPEDSGESSGGNSDDFGSGVTSPSSTGGVSGANPGATLDTTGGIESVESTGAGTVATLSTSTTPAKIEARVKSLYGSAGTTIKVLSNRITAKSSSIGVIGSIDDSSSDTTYTFSVGEIESLLNEGGSSDSFIFKIANTIADEIISDSSLRCERNGLTEKTGLFTETGLTRYSRWSRETMVLVVLEIFACVCSKFIQASFGANSSSYVVTIDATTNASVLSKFSTISAASSRIEGGSVRGLISDGTLTSGIDSLHSAMITEDAIVRDLINVFKGVVSTVKTQVDATKSFFNTSASTSTASSLRKLADEDWGAVFLDMFGETQINQAWYALSRLLKSSDVSLVPKSEVISRNAQNLIDALLRDPYFKWPTACKHKLLAVGITAGTLEALRHPAFNVGTDTTLEPDARDVVSVNVYRKDPAFEDIVFKPLQFVFDMSRFVNIETNDIPTGSTLDGVVSSYALLRDVTPSGGLTTGKNLASVLAETEYSDMTQTVITQMVRNHVIDYALKLYVKFLTGLDLSEYNFPASEALVSVQTSDEVDALLEAVDAATLTTIRAVFDPEASQNVVSSLLGGDPLFQTITGQTTRGSISTVLEGEASDLSGDTLSEVVASSYNSSLTSAESAFVKVQEATIPELSAFLNSAATAEAGSTSVTSTDVGEDYLKQLLSSLLFSSGTQTQFVLSPKLFERILFVPVCLDDFEVDVETTSETESGTNMLNNSAFRDCLTYTTDETGNTVVKLIPTNGSEDRVIMSEFLVTVTLGTEL